MSAAKVSYWRRCSGISRSRVRSGRIASTPRVRIGALSGRKRNSLPASVSVPAPAGLRAGRRPTARWRCRTGLVMPRAVGETQRAGRVGHAAPPRARGTARAMKCLGDLDHLRGREQPATGRARTRRACARAPRGATATRAWKRMPAGELAGDHAHDQHHREGEQVLDVAHARSEKRGGTKKKSKASTFSDRRERSPGRGPTARPPAPPRAGRASRCWRARSTA